MIQTSRGRTPAPGAQAFPPGSPVRRYLGPAALLLATLLGLGATGASAAVFCVATGDALASALDTAAANNQNDEIHVRNGTLTRAGLPGIVPRWQYAMIGLRDSSRTLVVSGGWTDCNTQVQDPRLTVLDAQYQGSALHFAMDSSSGSIRVTNLTVTRGYHNGNTLGGAARSANVGVYAPNSTLTATLDHLIIVSGQATTDGIVSGGLAVGGSGGLNIAISNNIIAYNTAVSVAGVGLGVFDSSIAVNNNSIFSNSASGTSATLYGVGLDINSSNSNVYVANNVVFGNQRGNGIAADLDNVTGNTYLRNNHIAVGSYPTAPIYNLNPTSGDPGWTLVGIFPNPMRSRPCATPAPMRPSAASAAPTSRAIRASPTPRWTAAPSRRRPSASRTASSKTTSSDRCTASTRARGLSGYRPQATGVPAAPCRDALKAVPAAARRR